MAKIEHYYTQFEEEKFYHVYNRSIDKQPMFRDNGNYEFFLKRFEYYLSDVLEIYAYCLLGNHFHFLIRINNLETFRSSNKIDQKTTAHQIVSKKFRHFFQSYAMAFNKQHYRIGTLFQTPFKRALVDEEQYFTQLVYYIHLNPQKHKLVSDFKDWKWSSYHGILDKNVQKLKKHELLDWFGSEEAYKVFHQSAEQLLKENLRID